MFVIRTGGKDGPEKGAVIAENQKEAVDKFIRKIKEKSWEGLDCISIDINNTYVEIAKVRYYLVQTYEIFAQ